MDIGHINNVTVERTSTNKYFVVLNVDFEPETLKYSQSSIGIDVGIKEFYTGSKGNIVHNPKYLEKSSRKLTHEQRKLSHMIESHITGYKTIGNKRFPIYDKPLSECNNAHWDGRVLINVPAFYPSSQMGSCCGYKNTDVKDLKIRKWTCPECGTVHGRDFNASVNILNQGLALA